MDALEKIKFQETFCIVGAQVSPSGEETGSQNYIAVIRIPPIGGALKSDTPLECTRSAVTNNNPQFHWEKM
ncbi:hypothetical protein TNCV_1596551 [Trichonephila clavipes]|nr:hypothetical protein TNCV_1596551 [Trichonephila clavipes]